MNDDEVIDQIPLSEIKVVREMIVEEDTSKVETKDMELMIETSPDGYNSGRTYYLQAETKVSRQEFINKISQYSASAYEKTHAQSAWSRTQRRVLKVYQSSAFQKFVAFLIVSVGHICYLLPNHTNLRYLLTRILQNFIICVLDAQYKQDSSEQFDRFVIFINYILTVIFAFELAINVCANWMKRFIRNGWNWLGVFIVMMSLLDFGPFDNPLWLVRLMRAFRVVRLFGRVSMLTKMISAITASLFPMLNAFVILFIVLSICE